MLTLSNLTSRLKKKRKKIRGRGASSGHGGYSGRGIKGQKARTGGAIHPGFEGGRMPLIRQLPKSRGFASLAPKPQTVTLSRLKSSFPDGGIVNPSALEKKRLINKKNMPIKIVGNEKLEKNYTIVSIKISKKARESVEAAGGKIVIREARPS